MENSSPSNNTGGGSDAAQRWFPPDIKQEEEEESVSQRGDLMDSTDQDHYKTEMEGNQNPEQLTDNPVNREDPDSPSATTAKQVSIHDVMIKPAS